jgi:hypothetical protein
MRVKVQRFVTFYGESQYGIYVKRWWYPVWIRVSFWDDEQVAIKKAEAIKHPQAVEIK